MGKQLRREELVVEVVAAHNLMPKDGAGTSSAYVEVEFENQKRRTKARPKDLNPVWNERLVFPLAEPDELPYRAIDVAVYNDRGKGAGGAAGAPANNRNFLGKVHVPAAGVPSPEEEVVPQLFPLEKRSLFSQIRGGISLKIYRAYASTVADTGRRVESSSSATSATASDDRKIAKTNDKKQDAPDKSQTKQQTPNNSTVHLPPQQKQMIPAMKQMNPSPVDFKPLVLAPGLQQMDRPYPVPATFVGGGGAVQDFALKETRPRLGAAAGASGKTSATYDLVEQMQYLYVRVVRAQDLPLSDAGEAHAEVKLGNYRGVTRSTNTMYWDQVFAFSKDTIQSSILEIFVKDGPKDDFIGRLVFDLGEVPRRVPPDSPLAPQWYRMDDKMGERLLKGELMASAWFGTQVDEAFAEAWHSKAASVQGEDSLVSIKSKVYVAPRLCYLRVSVLEAQDLVFTGTSPGRYPALFAKAQVGNQVVRTRSAIALPNRAVSNPLWNEDLMFVVSEPFDDILAISVEDRITPNHDELLARIVVPVSIVERRLNDKPVASRWFALDRCQTAAAGGDSNQFGCRIHLRLSLDVGYHVLEETTAYSSDLRPTAKQLWGPHVGVLELGILGASGLMPTKVRDGRGGTADAYCVAKYGQKWIRTRTVVDSVTPRWNEQYTWEVFDPCTVITVGVFSNCHIDKLPLNNTAGGLRDARIGKVRIRLSTLESDRVYTHAYPLLMLHPTGVKKMGELHLAIRLSCANLGDMLHAYVRPLLPEMHYLDPLYVRQLENLRFQATGVVAAKLGRAEPPLGREVVEYMLDHGSHLWSMRKSKANFFRLVSVLSVAIAVYRWIEFVRSWRQPVHSFFLVSVYIFLVACPELILPTAFFMMALIGMWRYRSRPRHPSHMDIRLSYADTAFVDELDEEFDTVPTSRSAEIVSVRYDRLRSVAGRVQAVMGDIGTQGERLQALLSWRDPRATPMFLAFCLVAAVAFYAIPMKVLVGSWGLYVVRPPMFRSRMPSPLMNFFRRLPTKSDSML